MIPLTGLIPAPSLREELSTRAVAREILLLLAIPAVLMLVFSLPESVRTTLVFRTDAPSIIDAFAAHYVHLSSSHLVGNLAIYAGAVGLGYPLAVLSGIRRLYVLLVISIVAAFPFVLSGLHMLLPGHGGVLGFSGLSLALVGLLPLVLFTYLQARVAGAVSINDAPALFFFGTAAIAWRTSATGSSAWPIVLASVALGGLYLVPLFGRLVRSGSQSGPGNLRRGYIELPVATVLLFFLALAMAFPIDAITPDDQGVNHTLHLLAYALGFIGAYLTERSLKILGPPSPSG